MEKTIELEGKKFKVRGLKRREVKSLRAEFPNGGEGEMERVFEMVGIKEKETGELYNASVLRLWMEINDLTFPGPEQLKNSNWPSTS